MQLPGTSENQVFFRFLKMDLEAWLKFRGSKMLVHTKYIFGNELSRDTSVLWCLFKATCRLFREYCRTEKAFFKMLNIRVMKIHQGIWGPSVHKTVLFLANRDHKVESRSSGRGFASPECNGCFSQARFCILACLSGSSYQGCTDRT